MTEDVKMFLYERECDFHGDHWHTKDRVGIHRDYPHIKKKDVIKDMRNRETVLLRRLHNYGILAEVTDDYIIISDGDGFLMEVMEEERTGRVVDA